MKGIAHFTIGVAAASCFPQAVEAGADGNPLYFILGGVFGIMPDTIDFKICRFFAKHDIMVTPDPLKPDPKMIANAMVHAVKRAHETGKPVKIQFDTVRLGADLWQQYSIRFDLPNKQVVVSYGPVIDTGGTPVRSSGLKKDLKAAVPLPCEIKLAYQATTTVDIFDGPLFCLEPMQNGMVRPDFIIWHRKWTHSFVICLLFGLVGTLILGPLAGLVIFSAHAAHIIADQLGFMGSNLMFPFYRKRTEGLKLLHSGESFSNFMAVWIACLIIFWNIYSASIVGVTFFTLWKIVCLGVILPFGLYFIGRSQKSEVRSQEKRRN
ncbi:metal-dependent hydrolase [Verrucomicrobiota bacterium]